MRLKSFNYIYCLLIISLCFTALKSEEKIDIWNKQNKTPLNEKKERSNEEEVQKLNTNSIKSIELNQKIKIEGTELDDDKKEIEITGIYDPEENDFNLNMWSSTNAEDIKASLKRLEKISLL